MKLSPIKRQSMIQLGFTILVTGIGFVSTMLFSHILGKDLMGVYALFVTYFTVFNLIGDSGFGSAAIKRIAEGVDQNAYFTAYMVLRTILILVSTTILLAIQPFFVDLSSYELVPLIIGALVIAYFSNAIKNGVSAKNHLGIVNMASGLSEIGRIAVSIVLVLLGFSLYGMIGGFFVGTFLAGFLCIKYFKYRPARFTRYHIKNLLSFSLWILLISTASTIMGNADTIFIGYFMQPGDVGVFKVALSFTSISLFLANAVNSTLAPKISYWSTHEQMNLIPPVISRSITYGLILAVPVLIGGGLLVNELLYYFYGADFAAGSICCCILLLQQIFNIFLIFIGSALSNSGYVRKTFYGTLAAVILNVLLDIILIPGFGPVPACGIEGAAIASLIAIIVNVLIVRYELKKVMNMTLELKPFLHILFSSAIMGVVVFVYTQFIPLSNILITLIPVAFGAGLYFIILLKIDRDIHHDISEILNNFGMKLPKWL